jgi:hypothetical protein
MTSTMLAGGKLVAWQLADGRASRYQLQRLIVSVACQWWMILDEPPFCLPVAETLDTANALFEWLAARA